jgi:hypothetical protein
MIEIIFNSVSCALFAWFFNYAIDVVPYLQWYKRLIYKLPDYLSDPLGNCPFCFAPWFYLLFIIFAHVRLFQIEVFQICFAFGWIYAANQFFSRYIEPKG